MPSEEHFARSPNEDRSAKRQRLDTSSTVVEDTPVIRQEDQRLCVVCQDMLCNGKGSLEVEQDWGRSFSHHIKFSGLQEAANRGCFFCSPFWQSFSSTEQDLLLELDDAGLNEYIDSGSEYACDDDETLNSLRSAVRFDLIYSSKSQYSKERELEGAIIVLLNISFEAKLMCTFIDERESARFLLRPIGDLDIGTGHAIGNTSSLQAWQVAQQWISTCNEAHQCLPVSPRIGSQKWYPTRLLDAKTASGIVRLVETTKEPICGTYITLSHRWGTHRPMVLCEDTLVALMSGISVTELPQAFQDAIIVCQRLSRYIWIDSLCIQQDSRSDWLREASLMHSVYSNSYLNISALAARDSGETIFSDRSQHPLDDLTLRTRLDGQLKMGKLELGYQVMAQSFWVQEVDCAHLNRRGWVLQERLLSPSILHFGRDQLYWECNHTQAAQRYRRGLPENLLSLQRALKQDVVISESVQTPETLVTSAHSSWYKAVETYSMCGLTKSEDKLIALAGVAKRIRSQLNDDYIGGMWRRTLVQDLCWRAHHRNVPGAASRPADYRAPTFSWTSLDTHIVPYTAHEPKALVEVVSTNIDYATADVTGLVTGGRLRIKCHLQSLSFGTNTALEPYMIINADETYSVPGWTIYGEQKPNLYLDEGIDTFIPIGKAGLFCFPILSCKSEDVTYPIHVNNVTTIAHLLVQLVDGSKDNFRRIGVSFVRIGNLDPAEMQAWLACGSEEDLPIVEDEEGWHVVIII